MHPFCEGGGGFNRFAQSAGPGSWEFLPRSWGTENEEKETRQKPPRKQTNKHEQKSIQEKRPGRQNEVGERLATKQNGPFRKYMIENIILLKDQHTC